MAKLFFRYGTVCSAKTLNLLAVAHNYKDQKKNIILMKPSLDNRFGEHSITSRAGLTAKADELLTANTRFYFDVKFGAPIDRSSLGDDVVDFSKYDDISCILVDEAQFLSPRIIEDLLLITIHLDIPVICCGLKTDFRGRLFDGSKRLLELADSIEEEKTTCAFCNKKATFNLKIKNGTPTTEGPVIDLGAEEKYLPSCKNCYYFKTQQ